MAKKQIKKYVLEPGISKDQNLYPNAYALLVANKSFIQAQLKAYIDFQIANNVSPFVGYTYEKSKCDRDSGYYLDAIAHDIRYGGNVKIRQVAQYFWIDGVPMIGGTRLPETAAQTYMRDLINNFIFTNIQATPLYGQNIVPQVFIVGANAESGASTRNSAEWLILRNVILNGTGSIPAKVTGVSAVKLLGKYDSSELLLITDTNNGKILYNFADNANTIELGYKTGVSSGDGQPLSDLDFPTWYNTQDGITTITFSQDTTNLTTSSVIQIFVEEPSQQIRPWEFGTDAIERMRVATPQAMLDADFEYGLQPTKWQAIGLQRSIPSLYEIPGTDTTVLNVITDASVNTGSFGASLITVTTNGPHGFSIGTPITIKGMNGAISGFSRAEGSFLVNTVPSPTTFTYYASSRVGTTPGEQIFTSSVQLRQAGFYTGAAIGTPSFSVASNGTSGTITTQFITASGSTGIAYSGTAPSAGSPISGSPGISPGTFIGGTVGAGTVNARMLNDTTSGANTYIDLVDTTGVQQGMIIDGGSSTARTITSIDAQRLFLNGVFNRTLSGSNKTTTLVSGTNDPSIGTSAAFEVSRSAGVYTAQGRIDSSSNGQNYRVSDQILIPGTSMGGQSPANDLTITITQVDSGGTVTGFTTAGTAISGGATYTGVLQDATTGTGGGATLDVVRTGGTGAYAITLGDGGSGYQSGDTVTFAGTSFGGVSPANDIVLLVNGVAFGTDAIVDYSIQGTPIGDSGNQTYSGVTGNNVLPGGSNAVFTITSDNGVYSATATTAGTGYIVGNRIKVLGNIVGGATPLNDVMLVVSGITTGGAISAVTATGSVYVGDPIIVYPALTLSDPTVALIAANTLLNTGAIATIEVNFANNHGLVPGAALLTSISSLPSPTFTPTTRTLSQAATWSSVTSGNSGRFVAVATGSNLTTFSDNGQTWSNGGNMPATATWSSVAVGWDNGGTGNRYYMAVAGSASTTSAWSTDGAGWTSSALPAAANWSSVAYYNGVWVAVASGSTASAVSTNGRTWAAGGTMPSTATWTSVAGGLIGSLAYFVAVASGGTTAAYSFDNGTTWTSSALPQNVTWSSVTYGNSRFVAVANGTTVMAYSTTGTSWVQGAMPTSGAWTSVTFGDDTFLAVMSGTTTAATSFDGTGWVSRIMNNSATWSSVSYNNYSGSGIFAVVGNSTNGQSLVLTSANHGLAAGPFIVSAVPTLTSIRYAARSTGTITVSTPISGVVYTRPDTFFQHRPFDGGVQLGTGGPQHGAQAVRQSKKYVRYQSGKGIMYTTGALFAPSYNLASATSTGLGINSLITYTTDDTDHGLQPGSTVEIFGFTTFEYNGTFVVESIKDSRAFRVRSTAILNTTTAIIGNDSRVVVKNWHGATVRAGAFDDQNGLFYQFDGIRLAVGKRSSTFQLAGTVTCQPNANVVTGSGTRFQDQLHVGDKVVLRGMSHTVTAIPSQTQLFFAPDYRGNTTAVGAKLCQTIDTLIPQPDWNMDTGDGNGPSGYNILPTKMQMIGIQYSWYAAGFIEFMLRGADGKFVFLHRIRNSNINFEAYMRTANLPVRYEVQNEGARSSLRVAIGNSDTVLTLANTYWFPTSGTVYIDNEIISYTGKSGDQLTGCSRGTTFTNYAAGSNRTYTAGSATSHAFGAGVILISVTISPAISHWGSALLTDGRFDEDRGYLFTYAATGISISTTKTTAFMIRLAPSVSNALTGDLGDRDLLNRAQLLLQQIAVTAETSTGGIVVEGVLNPQNYPTDPGRVTWAGLSGVAAGGQPSFAQIAPGGNVDWASGASQTTKTATTAIGNTQTRTNFLYFSQATWEACGAVVGTEVQDVTKFPAGTRVSRIQGPADLVGGGATGLEYLVTFTQNSTATNIPGASAVTFVFGVPPYALPGEQVFSFISNPGQGTESLDLSGLKELTTTALGGRGAFPNGPDILAINVYKTSGTAVSGNIILRWGEAQA
jgi:hypothetical protein